MGDQGERHLHETWHKKEMDALARNKRRLLQLVFISGLIYGALACFIAMREYAIDDLKHQFELYLGPRQERYDR
jgi:hypothetical protein